MNETQWISLGKISVLIDELSGVGGLKEIVIDEKKILISYSEGEFGAVSARCNHMGAPLSRGRIKKGCIECPWHYWSFHHRSGEAQGKSYEPLASHGGQLASYPLKIEQEQLWISVLGEQPRIPPQYNPMLPVAREPQRAEGRLRVLALSTTPMDRHHPRYSTSEDLLKSALVRSAQELNVETQFISLSDLNFRFCEGFYSKSERACTWPCSITKMDPQDEMVKIYEALVHWADIVIVGTSIRWGAASALYYKMAERLNSVQNQITLKDRVLIKNKVAGFVITGGQDNIQAVAGQMLNFFGELGFTAPPFPYVAHSLGWSAEKMEHNMDVVKTNADLHEQAFDLVARAVELGQKLIVENR